MAIGTYVTTAILTTLVVFAGAGLGMRGEDRLAADLASLVGIMAPGSPSAQSVTQSATERIAEQPDILAERDDALRNRIRDLEEERVRERRRLEEEADELRALHHRRMREVEYQHRQREFETDAAQRKAEADAIRERARLEAELAAARSSAPVAPIIERVVTPTVIPLLQYQRYHTNHRRHGEYHR